MERLTYDFCVGNKHCWQVKGADNLECREVCRNQGENGCTDCPIAKAFDRLAAYEDTGLEPEKIEQLKGEVFGLKVDKQELEQAKRERRIIPKGYALVKLKLLEELDNFRELGPIVRLRELAQADREKRIIVIPKDNNELLEKLKDLFFSDWATLRREQDG